MAGMADSVIGGRGCPRGSALPPHHHPLKNEYIREQIYELFF
jgi:hypothetical protein